jgi:amino acid permease
MSLYYNEMERIENEIRNLEESRRQFIVDYGIYQIKETGSFNSFDIDSKQKSNKHQMKSRHNSSLSIGGGTGGTAVASSTGSFISSGSPFIVYSLHDYDILEDWSIIKMHSNLSNNLEQNFVS